MDNSFRDLAGKRILITGAARRVGRSLALAAASHGATILLHHSSSPQAAEQVKAEIEALGSQAVILQADFADPQQAGDLFRRALEAGPVDALVNSAAIFEQRTITDTSLADWEQHLTINLTAPFLLSQAFAASLPQDRQGRIINILDWRALRPGPDHLPYTISKAGLAALTRSLAVALAPRITVNGLALGAILPPSSGGDTQAILDPVPANRWAELREVDQAFLFLLTGPAYITGEIIHVDGGRHLV
jgi:NAD(P)-dependent dehydrogenase (short-subunit alcohol dehydrogenase family)